jgi:hypothetical protein
MKAYGGVDAYTHVFYTPVLVGEWSASCLGRFNHVETVPMLNYLITKP